MDYKQYINEYFELICLHSKFSEDEVKEWDIDFFLEICRLIDNVVLEIELNNLKDEGEE